MGEIDARRKAWDGREAIVLEFGGTLGLVVGGFAPGGDGRYNYFVGTVAEKSLERRNISWKLQCQPC